MVHSQLVVMEIEGEILSVCEISGADEMFFPGKHVILRLVYPLTKPME